MITKCIKCGRKSLIYAKGMCNICYVVLQNKKHPSKQKAREERWKKKNKLYWRIYQRKKGNIPKSRWKKE